MERNSGGSFAEAPPADPVGAAAVSVAGVAASVFPPVENPIPPEPDPQDASVTTATTGTHPRIRCLVDDMLNSPDSSALTPYRGVTVTAVEASLDMAAIDNR
jgi:hypothetical protein